jgi:hypothetical protein
VRKAGVELTLAALSSINSQLSKSAWRGLASPRLNQLAFEPALRLNQLAFESAVSSYAERSRLSSAVEVWTGFFAGRAMNSGTGKNSGR